MSILRFLFQTLCAFLQIKDKKYFEQNYQAVAGVMPCWDHAPGVELGVLGGSKAYELGFAMAPHRLRSIDCLCLFLFIFSFFFFFATFSFIFSRGVPF